MKKITARLLATCLILSMSSPSFAQLGMAASDDGLLGGMIPRAASNQAPSVPAIVGGTGVADRAAVLDRESVLRQTVITSNQDKKSTEPTQFQKYVQEATGSRVEYFGSEFFSNNPSSFAPVQNIPVPSDYEYGPGDEILVRAWGGINVDYRAVVDRNGLISIPAVGTIPMAGVKASQAEGVIKAVISKSFSNFQINVSPGQIKAIRVYVVGQANKPGVYTISSLSTLITAMFVTGGPNASGSMRNIQLKRAGKIIATVDMYTFIAKGDKAQDVKLLEGDTIVIPPVHGHVAIVGKIDAPAIYELKDASETIENLLALTGGLPPVADPLMATLERLDPKQKPARFYVDITLDQQGQQQALVSGDILTVLPISTTLPMAKRNVYVRIEGEVQKPGLYQVKPGQTTQDLIKLAGGPTKEAYLFGTAFYRESTRVQQVEAFDKVLKRLEASLKSQSLTMASQVGGGGDAVVLAMKNQAAAAAGQSQLARLRSIKPEGRITLNLEPGINQVSMLPSLILEPNDRLVIPAKSQFVQIYGAVNVEAALMYQSGDTVSDYLRVAGLQKEADRDGIFVARPDGSVLMHGGFFSGIQSAELYPGDVVIVPEKFDRETGYSVFMRGLKDWTQVLGQLGLAAAAIKVLK